METYNGHVRTPQDAIILFEACRVGILPRVQRRLSEKERQQIKSGSVFVWDEREAGMRRWTDGKSWSASRVSGSFLTYREMEGKRGGNGFAPSQGGKKSNGSNGAGTPNSGRNGDSDEDNGAEPDGYRYKPDGLMKQSFSITTSDGRHLHLISYYAPRSQPTAVPLKQPSTDPQLKNIRPQKGMYPESTVNEAASMPAVTRGPMPGSPYANAPHPMGSPYGPPIAHQSYLQSPPGYPPPGWPASPMNTPPTHYSPYHPGYPPPPGHPGHSPLYAPPVHYPPHYGPPPAPTQFDRPPPPMSHRAAPPPALAQPYAVANGPLPHHRGSLVAQYGMPPQQAPPPVHHASLPHPSIGTPDSHHGGPPPDRPVAPPQQLPALYNGHSGASPSYHNDQHQPVSSAPPTSVTPAPTSEPPKPLNVPDVQTPANGTTTPTKIIPSISALVNEPPPSVKGPDGPSAISRAGSKSPGHLTGPRSAQDVASAQNGYNTDNSMLRTLDKNF